MYCLEELLSYLIRYRELCIELKKYPTFNKLSSSNKLGDFISVCCSVTNNEILEKELQQLIEECPKDVKKISVASFNIRGNRIYLKLDWLSTIKSVFIDVFESPNAYGSSTKFCNKTVKLCCDESDNELTQRRVRTAGDVVAGLVALGGGSVTDCTDAHCTVSISPRQGSSFLVGPVHLAGSTDTSAANYFQLRRTQLQNSDHRELSEESVEQLVDASIVFELLSVKLSKPLILNSSIVPSSASRSNCKGATFVLYNYARICSILDKFEDMVSLEIFKPLSSLHDLDYNLLLKEEERKLVFDFLAEWPFVVADCQNLSQPKLHNMVAFLSSLASTFSVFYKYNRVLNDGQEHMVPLMEARIYLLKAIKQVFLVAFTLLKINAPTKM